MIDIIGETCETTGTYLTVKIDGTQAYKTETISSSSHITFTQTFVSGYISTAATVEIEMWGSIAGSSTDVRMSTWNGTAEYYASRGKQTLLGIENANHQQNSLTIRAEWVIEGKACIPSTNISMYTICLHFIPTIIFQK